MKICKKCNLSLSIKEFSKNKNNKDGLENYCKKCTKIRMRSWREKNKKYDRERKIIWRNKNLEYDKKRKSDWSSKNLEKRRLSYHKRNIKIKENIFYISNKEIKKILSSPCFYCGSKNNIEIDHVVPISKGGRHSIGNIVPACRSCNASKCNKYLFYWKINNKGLIL